MQSTYTEYDQLVIQHQMKLLRFAAILLETTDEDLKNMDIKTLTTLFRSLRVVTALLAQEMIQRGLITTGKETSDTFWQKENQNEN